MENVKISCAVGDKIRFGDCEWRVLDIQDNKALVLSERTLGERHYHNEHGFITWETSSLRKLLNGNFYNSFGMEEKFRIKDVTIKNDINLRFGTSGGVDTSDKVFLLSIEEVIHYFGESGQLKSKNIEDRSPIDDQYSEVRIARDNLGSASDWWLRSPGGFGTNAAFVDSEGRINLYGACSIPEYGHDDERCIALGVRPALWLDMVSVA